MDDFQNFEGEYVYDNKEGFGKIISNPLVRKDYNSDGYPSFYNDGYYLIKFWNGLKEAKAGDGWKIVDIWMREGDKFICPECKSKFDYEDSRCPVCLCEIFRREDFPE